MKKYPLLTILIISSLLVTLPGILLNTKLIVTSESDNYSLKKIAASSTIHELKLLTEKAYAKLTRNENSMVMEGAVPVDIPDLQEREIPELPSDAKTDEHGADEQDTSNDTEESDGNEESSGDVSQEEGSEGESGEEDSENDDPSYKGDPQNPDFQTVDDSYFLDACFIGDSRTKGFGMYSGLDTTVYAKVGLQLYKVFDDRVVDTVYGKLTIPEALASGIKFGKIYLMFGLNEMGWGNDEQFMQYYYYLIDTVKGLQPDAIIYVQQIIHVTAKKAASSPVFANDKIDHRNELLRKVAEDENVYYLELNEVFTDEEGNLPADYSFDGVHFAADSMKIWKDYLETHAIVLDTDEEMTVTKPEIPDPMASENTTESTEQTEPESAGEPVPDAQSPVPENAENPAAAESPAE